MRFSNIETKWKYMCLIVISLEREFLNEYIFHIYIVFFICE